MLFPIDERGRTFSADGREVKLSPAMVRAVNFLNQDGYVDTVDGVTVGTIVALMDRGILREAAPLFHNLCAGRHYPATTPEQVWDEARIEYVDRLIGEARDEEKADTLTPAERAFVDECQTVEAYAPAPLFTPDNPGYGRTVHFGYGGRTVSGTVRGIVHGGGLHRVTVFSPDLGHTHRIDHGITIDVADLLPAPETDEQRAARHALDKPLIEAFNALRDSAPTLADDVAVLRSMIETGSACRPATRSEALEILDRIAGAVPQRPAVDPAHVADIARHQFRQVLAVQGIRQMHDDASHRFERAVERIERAAGGAS